MLRGVGVSAAVVFLAWPMASWSAEDDVFDVPALIATPLNAQTLKSTEGQGIVTEEVQFHSEKDGGKEVSIFAFFSYPKGARKAPAFIWNPGGLGQANPDFTQRGARRGYAVLCIDFPQPGYRSTGGYPINAGLELGDDPRQAPIYHGAVALLKAVSYLESRGEVDRDRIGMAGSSWGGFFTTLMVGVDPRLKVGSSLYGTGSLQLGNAWWDGQSRHEKRPPTPAQRERWRKTLDPAWRLPKTKTPVAWITGTNDGFYSLASVMHSYEMAAGPKHLTLLPNWDHALPPKLQDEQVYLWLDVYLKGQGAFLKLTPVTVRKDGERLLARWDFEGAGTAADLIVSYGDAGNWQGRYWHTLKAEIRGHTCEVELPAATLPCYVSGAVTDKSGFRYSTPWLRVGPTRGATTASLAMPDYNGCAPWGGFEEDQIAFLARHDRSGQKRWVPRPSLDAREGKHSAVLPGGKTVLPPILSTATVPHRFTCFLKADQSTAVTVQLAGQHKQFRIGTKWTEVGMDLTPPNDLMGGIAASITIPSAGTVLVDAVRFHPVLATEAR